MAVNESRSLNVSLDNGATDGRYRKRRPDTEVADTKGDALLVSERSGLHPTYNYGFITTDAPNQVNPGRCHC